MMKNNGLAVAWVWDRLQRFPQQSMAVLPHVEVQQDVSGTGCGVRKEFDRPFDLFSFLCTIDVGVINGNVGNVAGSGVLELLQLIERQVLHRPAESDLEN